MIKKPTQHEVDEFESFARAATGAKKDSTRKAAPVDTVRLKKDINKDMARAADENFTATMANYTGSRPTDASRYHEAMHDANLRRAVARADTLEQARKAAKGKGK